MNIDNMQYGNKRNISAADNGAHNGAGDMQLPDERIAAIIDGVRRGDERAAADLLSAYAGLVASVAKRYARRGMPMADATSVCSYGLLTAATKFDAQRGVDFAWFAARQMRSSMSQAMKAEGNDADQQGKDKSGLRKAVRQFVQEEERLPSATELAATMNSSEENVAMSLHGNKTISTDVQRRGDGSTLADRLAADGGDESATMGLNDALKTCLTGLNEREQRVLSSLYGFDGEMLTMAETGARLGLSRERVRQIRNKAVRKLRRLSRDNGLKDFI